MSMTAHSKQLASLYIWGLAFIPRVSKEKALSWVVLKMGNWVLYILYILIFIILIPNIYYLFSSLFTEIHIIFTINNYTPNNILLLLFYLIHFFILTHLTSLLYLSIITYFNSTYYPFLPPPIQYTLFNSFYLLFFNHHPL